MELSWFPLVIVYIIGSAITRLIQKVALNDERIDSTAFSAFFQFMVGVFTIPALFFETVIYPTSFSVWVMVLLSSLVYTICMALYYYALQGIEISQVETLATTRTIWFMILGVLFFKENLSMGALLGGGLIFIGLLVIYGDGVQLGSFKKPHVYTMIYGFLISIGFALDKYNLSYFSVSLYQVILYILPGIFTMVLFPRKIKHIGYFFKPHKNTFLIYLSCVIQAIAILGLYSAYKFGGQLSIVGPLSQTATVLIILFGIVMLKERWNLRRKIVGVTLALLGVFFTKLM